MGPTPTPTRTLGMRLSCNFVNVDTIVYREKLRTEILKNFSFVLLRKKNRKLLKLGTLRVKVYMPIDPIQRRF